MGDHTYFVDQAGEASEQADEGIDLVRSSVSYTLGAHIEDLALTGSVQIDGTGNELDNVLTGNGAANSLTGGVGQDLLRGGMGNDTYTVDAQGEAVERAGQGTNTVRS